MFAVPDINCIYAVCPPGSGYYDRSWGIISNPWHVTATRLRLARRTPWSRGTRINDFGGSGSGRGPETVGRSHVSRKHRRFHWFVRSFKLRSTHFVIYRRIDTRSTYIYIAQISRSRNYNGSFDLVAGDHETQFRNDINLSNSTYVAKSRRYAILL